MQMVIAVISYFKTFLCNQLSLFGIFAYPESYKKKRAVRVVFFK